MEFNEDTPFIDDSYKGDVVTLVSNTGGKKDRKFSRNYAWAKHAADRGVIKQIVVKVVANGEAYRTVDAFRRALGRPHPATRVVVAGPEKHAAAIADEVARIVPAPEESKVPRGKREPASPVVEPAVPAVEPEVTPETTEEVQ